LIVFSSGSSEEMVKPEDAVFEGVFFAKEKAAKWLSVVSVGPQ